MIIEILPTSNKTFILLDVAIAEQECYYGQHNLHVVAFLKSRI